MKKKRACTRLFPGRPPSSRVTLLPIRTLSAARPLPDQSGAEPRLSLQGVVRAYGKAQGPGLSHDHDELLSAGYARVDEVALQHHEMLHRKRNHDDRVLASLRFVDSRRVAEDEFVEVRVVVGNFPSVEVDRERLILLVLSNTKPMSPL